MTPKKERPRVAGPKLDASRAMNWRGSPGYSLPHEQRARQALPDWQEREGRESMTGQAVPLVPLLRHPHADALSGG